MASPPTTIAGVQAVNKASDALPLKENIGSLSGRVYSVLDDAMKEFRVISLKFCKAVIHQEYGVDTVQKIGKVFYAIFLNIEHYCAGVKIFAITPLSSAIELVDGVQIFGDIKAIADGTFKKQWDKGIDIFAGTVVLVLANVTATLNTIGNQFKWVNLVELSAKMGGVRLFGVRVFAFVPKLNLGVVGSLSVAIGCLLVHRETFEKWMSGEDLVLNRRTLIYAAFEITLQLALVAGAVGSAVLAVRLAAHVSDVFRMYTLSNLK